MFHRIKSPFVVIISFIAMLSLMLTGLALSASATSPTVDIEAVAGRFLAPGVPTDGTPALQTTLDTPSGVAVDPEGNYVIADRYGYLQVLANSATNPGYVLGDDCGGPSTPCVWTQGDVFTIAGGGSSGTDGASALTYALARPTGIAVDPSGNVIIPMQDANDALVLAVSGSNPGYPLRSDCVNGSTACSWIQGGVYVIVGQSGSSAALTDGSTAASSSLEKPDYASLDSSGNLILDDYNSGVVVLARSATNPGYVLGNDCGTGSTACVWTQGDVFTLAGSWSGCGSGSDGQAGIDWNFCESRGVAVDSSGNVVIADSDNGLLVVLAESATNPGYQLENDCGTGSTACAWTPGDIFVLTADPYYSGTSPSAGSPSLGTDTEVFFPSGNTFDGQGNLLFANNQYQVIDMLAMSSCSSDCPYGLATINQGDIYLLAGGATSNPGTYGEHGSPTSAYLGAWNNSAGANFLAIDNVNGAVVLADAPINTVRTFDGGEIAVTTTTYRAPPIREATTTTSTTTTSTTTTTTTTTMPTTTTTLAPRPRIRANFYFALDVTVLSAAQKSQLGSIARAVRNERIAALSVVGYSDPLSQGGAANAIGVARANAVAAYLHQRLVSLGDGAVTIGRRSGGVLKNRPYSNDRVAVLTS
jgi:outer membrane protein OmpA-like peptidoglycan-associated protein